jgi:phage-related protein
MADNQDTNLVSNVQITGTEESLSVLNKYADEGAAAFEKVNKAATQSAAGVKTATAGIDASAQSANKSLGALGNTKISNANVRSLQDISKAATQLGVELRKTTQDVAQFAARTAALATAAVVAGAGLLKMAANVAKQSATTSSALEDQTKAQQDQNSALADAAVSQLNYENAQKKLQDQLTAGTISWQQYSDAMGSLEQDYQNQQRMAARTAAIQDEVAQANERLQKRMADTKAYQALADMYGGPLLSSLTALGNQVNVLWTDFKNAFGPAVAGLVDNVLSTLSKNSGAIQQFFDQGSKAIADFVKNNGPQIQQAIESIGRIMAGVFDGLISALPALLDFFNTKFIPALDKVGSVLTTIANLWNKAFGTNATGGMIGVIVIVTQMTGGFKLLWSTIMLARAALVLLAATTGVWGVAITAVVAVLALLATTIDWKKFGDAAKDATTTITASFAELPNKIIGYFTGLWGSIKATADNAAKSVVATWSGLTTFFAGLPLTIGLVFTGMWSTVTTAASAAADAVVMAWGTLTAFFAGLPDTITSIFSNIWDAIANSASVAAGIVTASWGVLTDFFNVLGASITTALSAVWDGVVTTAGTAATALQGAWQVVVSWFPTAFNTISETINNAWQTITATVTDATQAVIDNWQAVLEFFQTLPEQATQIFTDVGTAISDAFKLAVDTVKQYLEDLMVSAMSYLQPILDALKSIISMNSEAGQSSSAQGFAGGGSVWARRGTVRGAGTSTSDSIAAWLSNNEFVMTARAVRKYGTDFMHAINSGKFDPSSFIRGFARGGLVGAFTTPQVSFVPVGGRSGGTRAMSRILNLTIGDQTFSGLLAPDNVADSLTQFAVNRQARSAGRKPGWVGGTR